jgi:hypothetical protein
MSTVTVINTNSAATDDLTDKVMTLPQVAKSLIVMDQETYDLAVDKLGAVVAMRREITEYHAPLKQKAHEAHQAICDAEKTLLAPVAEAERILKRSIADYHTEQARIQAERERIAREEQERILAEAVEASILAAEKEGATTEEVKAIINQPIVAPKIHIPPTYQAAAGISIPKTYHAEVTNIRELCRAVAKGEAPETYVTANMPCLNGVARSTRGMAKIPGVRIVEDANVRAGRR